MDVAAELVGIVHDECFRLELFAFHDSIMKRSFLRVGLAKESLWMLSEMLHMKPLPMI